MKNADNIDVSPQDLDKDAWTIMRIIAEEQKTDTSEIKRKTDLEKNHRILYRADKLEELGWISIHRPDNVRGGVSPPKKYKLRRNAVEDYLEARPDDDEMTIDERLSKLERRVDGLDGDYDNELIRLSNELQELREEFLALREYLLNELNVSEKEITQKKSG